jgi:hypothetical protein
MNHHQYGTINLYLYPHNSCIEWRILKVKGGGIQVQEEGRVCCYHSVKISIDSSCYENI